MRAAFVLMVASGFAGLGYQVVWTQQSALWIGHELPAVLAVVTAFFGGLALGALALGGRIARSAQPARWYAGFEVIIAGWSLVLAFGMAPASGVLLALIGAEPGALRQGVVAFVGTFLLLLPATAAMGATLPAMERITAGLRQGGREMAGLYACNTFGAVLGVVATAFWLVPEIGLVRTVALCAALNLLCAGAARLLARRPMAQDVAAQAADPAQASATHPAAGPAATRAAAHASTRSATPAGATPLQWTLAATGLLGIGYEVLVVRVLSQVTEDTVYTFALLLAVYLLGTAAGAALIHRAGAAAALWRDRLILLTAAACLAGTASLWGADALRGTVQSALAPVLGDAMVAALAAEATLALVAFALPTLAMGALFSHLCNAALGAGVGLGRALGVNTLGAAAAPLVFGVLAVPLLGAKFALLIVCTAYLVLLSPAAWRRPAAWATAAALPAVALLAPPLAFVDVPDGGRIVHYEDGAMAAVSVVEDADGVLRLRINNRQQEGSSATRLADARQALLPLALHPAPQRVLFLGLGTGVTASAAAADPTLQVDAAELLPEVIAASALFREPGDGATAPQPRVVAADARRFVRATEFRYDLIVSDNFHPARSGSGSLYTVEHFQAVKARLNPDGVFCQWLPLHQMDLETLRSIVRAFVAVNPGAWAVLATNSLETPTLGLVARADGGRFDLRALQTRLGDGTGPLDLAGHSLPDVWAVLGSAIAGPQALARWSAGAPLNTDDRPVVAYRAPRITYAPDSLPRERLLALLPQLGLTPAELVGDADPATGQRLAVYWTARDRFLEAGRNVVPVAGAAQMLAQVREPLLEVLRISPDFRPAYDPLLRLAGALARSDPDMARTLLAELQQVQPARAEAGQALAQLAGAPR